MSFLDSLKGFGGWFAKEWKKVFNAAPEIEKIADTVISYAAPALQIILGTLDPAAAAIVGPIIIEAQKDLHVASGLIFDFGANPNANSILAGVVSSLQGIESAGHIKDATVQNKLNLVVGTIASLVQSLESALSAPAA